MRAYYYSPNFVVYSAAVCVDAKILVYYSLLIVSLLRCLVVFVYVGLWPSLLGWCDK